MNDNKFWVCISGMLAVVLIIFTAALTISSITYNAKLAASDKPIELACASQGSTHIVVQSCLTLQLLKKETGK